FTREFFQIARSRLREGGVFGSWIQLYGMDRRNVRSLFRTFRDVFGRIVVFQPAPAGDLLLVGCRGKEPVIPRARLEGLFTRKEIVADLARVGVESPADLAAYFLADDEAAARFVEGDGDPPPLNTDDNSFIEFHAPRTIFLKERNEAIQEEIERGYRGPLTVIRGYRGKEAAVFLAETGEKERKLREPLAEILLDLSRREAPTAAAHALAAELRGGADPAAARLALAEGLRLDPRHPRCLRRAASLADEAKRPGEALRHLARLVELDPTDGSARYLLGKTRVLAADRLRKSIPTQPAPGPSSWFLDPALVLRVFAAANFARALSDFSALEDAGFPRAEAERLLYFIGTAREGLGDEAGAIDALRAHLRWKPADVEARKRLASLLRKAGRMTEAEAVAPRPHDPERGFTLWEQSIKAYAHGVRKEAAEGLLLVVQIAPYSAFLSHRVALAFYRWGMFDEAIEMWRKALRLHPGDEDIATNFAFLAEYFAAKAEDPAVRNRLREEALAALKDLLKRKLTDPAMRGELTHRVKELEKELGGKSDPFR
ncbi:MAG: tetratricopeptide repeat protein, partial [Planctomycetota bacterium]